MRPTTRSCSLPRSPGCCSTPTSKTTSASQPCSLRCLDLLGDHCSKLRQCLPRWLEVLRFRSLRDDDIIEGIEVLRRLNRTGRRTVPEEAPPTFVPKAWLPLVLSASDKVSRRFWELALLWQLRDRLRSGDIWVEGSRRYAHPGTYLLDKARWPSSVPATARRSSARVRDRSVSSSSAVSWTRSWRRSRRCCAGVRVRCAWRGAGWWSVGTPAMAGRPRWAASRGCWSACSRRWS